MYTDTTNFISKHVSLFGLIGGLKKGLLFVIPAYPFKLSLRGYGEQAGCPWA